MHFMSFGACRVAALALAIFLTSTWGVRRLEKEVQSVAHGAGSKLIAGVPILNYHLAYAGKTLSSKKHMRAEPVPGSKHPESWIVVMSKEATDDQLHQLCAKVPGGCTKEGHHAGIPFITVHGSEEELSEVITAAGGAAKYVEPDIVWEAPLKWMKCMKCRPSGPRKAGRFWHRTPHKEPKGTWTYGASIALATVAAPRQTKARVSMCMSWILA